jgi:hypothetical protein
MVKPPSSVSFITCGSKSFGTPVGSSALPGCLRSFFTCAPFIACVERLSLLSQYRSWGCIAGANSENNGQSDLSGVQLGYPKRIFCFWAGVSFEDDLCS